MTGERNSMSDMNYYLKYTGVYIIHVHPQQLARIMHMLPVSDTNSPIESRLAIMKLEFTVYESTGIVEAPGPTRITVKEFRTAEDPVTRVTLEYDPPMEDFEKHPIAESGMHMDMEEYRPSSIERTWKYVIRDESGIIVYRGEVEKLFVRNTLTDREFRLVSFEVSYCGPESEDRSFRMTGTEESRPFAEEAMLMFAEKDSKRRTGN